MIWKHKEFQCEKTKVYVEIDGNDKELEIYIESSYDENSTAWLTKEQALELAEFIIEGYKDVQ